MMFDLLSVAQAIPPNVQLPNVPDIVAKFGWRALTTLWPLWTVMLIIAASEGIVNSFRVLLGLKPVEDTQKPDVEEGRSASFGSYDPDYDGYMWGKQEFESGAGDSEYHDGGYQIGREMTAEEERDSGRGFISYNEDDYDLETGERL